MSIDDLPKAEEEIGFLVIDQGTTSTRAIVFDGLGRPRAVAQEEFPQHFPRPGWVEHDPEEIWRSVLSTARAAFEKAEAEEKLDVLAVAITNQRETTVIWDRASGEPIANAIVWQDRRTAGHCAALREEGREEEVQRRTGLLLDPYFSATKIAWLLDNVPRARERAERGELAFGTIDSFLLWRLTGGARHATDVTNASRTLLFNLVRRRWDDEMCRLFGVPKAILPEVCASDADYGLTGEDVLPRPLPIRGIAGDQQAALIGQGCFAAGRGKITFGTGAFALVHTGPAPTRSRNRLLSTIAYEIGDRVAYALEGAVFNAGTVVKWLRDELGLIREAAETEELARSIPSTEGVYCVPAFTGLGAPHWDPDARGVLCGLTRGTTRAHLVRAALEGVGHQVADLLEAMRADGVRLKELRVDGGMAANDWLMGFVADLAGVRVLRADVNETTALGGAFLAGLSLGVYHAPDEIAARLEPDREFVPTMTAQVRQHLRRGWREAVARARLREAAAD
ncbi:MAG: glycerol kinase [Rhodothalassiaceae bacterium]|nr:MAG: glycerol kinase [Rhodothalassiaceae bacterium]